jgi:hypothetical protein
MSDREVTFAYTESDTGRRENHPLYAPACAHRFKTLSK